MVLACRERTLGEALFKSYSLLSGAPGASAVDEVRRGGRKGERQSERGERESERER